MVTLEIILSVVGAASFSVQVMHLIDRLDHPARRRRTA